MKHLQHLLLVSLATGALAGCNMTTNSGGIPSDPIAAANKGQAQAIVNIDESADPVLAGMMADDETVESAASIVTGPGAYGPSASPLALIPDSVHVCWYRHILHTDKSVNASGDSAAMTVTLTRTNDGLFVGRLCERHGRGRDRGHGHGDGEPDTALYSKLYSATWTRTAMFQKQAQVDSDRCEEGTRWLLLSTNLPHTTSSGSPQIVSVTIAGKDSMGNPVQVVFTDPTLQFDPRTLPFFAEGDSVTVKVVTDAPTTELAFIHFDDAANDHPRCWRRPLAYNAVDNAFEGSFKVRKGHGMGHFRHRRIRTAAWVDVLTAATINDTEAPYAATGWGIPYRLRYPHPMFVAREQ